MNSMATCPHSQNDQLKWPIGFNPVLAPCKNALQKEGWDTFNSLRLKDMQQCVVSFYKGRGMHWTLPNRKCCSWYSVGGLS